MLEMVKYLHKKFIIFRDFKLSNIMVDEKGFLKLIDFDLAKNLL